MVSFQCDGCQDVVKKPKLDSHGARCHASFTCIDCSKTFAGPAQWKNHTSCMSEEQKYHKSVYQEPRGRGRGRGQRGGRGGRGGGRPSYGGSGENAIPLGTQLNAWTAPPPDPVNNEPFNSNEWTASGDKAPAEAQAPEATSSIGDAPESEKKSKKSKKRKAEEVEAAQPTPAAETTTEEPAKKKKKKQVDEPVTELTSSDQIQPEVKEKKRKSRKSEVANEDVAAAQHENGTLNPDTSPSNTEVAVDEKKKKEKTEKKDKKEKKEKKSKKSRKSGGIEEAALSEPNGESPATVPLATFVNNNAHTPTAVTEGPSSDPQEATAEPGESNGVGAVNGYGESRKKEKSGKKDKKDKKDKRKEKQSNGAPVEELATSEFATPNEPQSETNDLIPIPTIQAKDEKKKEKKAKKEKKSKDTTGMSPRMEPAPEQDEAPAAESKKSKKRKAKDEPAATIDSAPAVSDPVSNGDAGSNEKPKKKSKRREKEAQTAAT